MSNLLRADQVSLSQRVTTAWVVHQRAEAQVGDLVCVTFSYRTPSSLVTAPDGTWTALPVADLSGSITLASFYKTLTVAGAADYTFTGTTGRPYIGHCAVIAGGAPVATTASATFSTTASRAAATPASAGSLVLAYFCAARGGSIIPVPTGSWRRRCSGWSGSDSTITCSYFGVFAIDNHPASAAPALTLALPIAGWVAQTLVFPPNAQPPADTLSDVWAPHLLTGVWAPISEAVPVGSTWVV